MERSFDVFLSYRRSGGGFETANLLYNRLTHAGYRVFMVVENLRSGKFNDQLYNRSIPLLKTSEMVITKKNRNLDR